MVSALAIRTLEVEEEKVSGGVLTIPKLRALENARTRIDDDDEREIRFHMSDPCLAHIRGSSGFGGQLERASEIGYGPLPCRRCGGKWRMKLVAVEGERDREVWKEWRDGTGFAPKKTRKGKRVTYAAALKRYRVKMQAKLKIEITTYPKPPAGSTVDPESAWLALIAAFAVRGQRLMTERELNELFPELPESECETCDGCNGLGIVPRQSGAHSGITAWPTGSSKQQGESNGEARLSLSHTAAERYLAVAAQLQAVAKLSPLARLAIEEYYSPPDFSFVLGSRRAVGLAALKRLAALIIGSKCAESALARTVAELRDHMGQAWNAAGARS